MTINIDRLAKAFINLRDARAELKKKFTAEDEDLKAKQEIINSEMLRFLNETGQKSASTESGTVYKQEEITPTGSDWDAFYRWVVQHDAFEALEKRIKKGFIKEYMEAHEGGIPPGVSVYREYVVRVRRS